MQVVFDGRMDVSYGQAYVEPQEYDTITDYGDAFAGQINGLLGAGEAGRLYLTTGLHTGQVGFRLVIAQEAPRVGDEWEDVVETTFVPEGPSTVVQWGGEVLCEFDVPPVPHRARYSARGMDEGHDADVVMHDEPLVDHYELTLWPADPAPEQIVRQGSRSSAYWHDARNHEKVESRRIRAWWGENPPSERLIDVYEARWLVGRRPELAEQLAAASPAAQRAVAYWVARRCCEKTGLDQKEWVAQALRLQGRNEILPPEFSRRKKVKKAAGKAAEVRGAKRAPKKVGVRSQALTALVGSDHEQPLLAALHALTDGTPAISPERQEAFLDEVADVLTAHAGLASTSDPRHDPWNGDFMKRSLWGDEPPHPRLVEVFAHELTGFDPVLAVQLAEAQPQVQRAVAHWAARRAITAAGLDRRFPEVALALDLLERGEPFAPPFDEEGGEFALLRTGEESLGSSWIAWVDAKDEPKVHFPEVPTTPESELSLDIIAVDSSPTWSRPHYTLPVIRVAADPDPLRAATQAVWTAACSFGNEHRRSILRECSDLLRDGRF